MKGKLRYLVISFLLVAAVFTFGNNYVFADETTGAVEVTATEELNNPAVKVYIFRGEGCSHCAEALAWFEEIEPTEGKYFDLVKYEVWNDQNNKALMDKVAAYFKEEASGVPYIVIGERTFKGFDASYKDEIINIIHSEYVKNVESRFDVIDYLNNNKGSSLGTYLILGFLFALIVFVIVARVTNNDDSPEITYEDDDNDEEVEEIVKHDEDEEPVIKEEKKTSPKKSTKAVAEEKKETSSKTKSTKAKTASKSKKSTSTKKSSKK